MARKNELTTHENSLPQLVELVNKSVETYSNVAPKYKFILENVMETISQKDFLDTLDVDHLFKLVELTNKNIIQPLEMLTKLVQAVSSLKENLENSSNESTLATVINKISEAKEEAEGSHKSLGDVIDAETT